MSEESLKLEIYLNIFPFIELRFDIELPPSQ